MNATLKGIAQTVFALVLLSTPTAWAQDDTDPADVAPVGTTTVPDLGITLEIPRSPGLIEAPEGKDWIKLTTGEWLQGDFKGLRNGTITFDSEELDVLKLDFSSVDTFGFPSRYTYVLDDGNSKLLGDSGELEEVVGPGTLKDGVVTIDTEDERGVLQFPRERLLSLVTGADSEWSYWSTLINLSLTGTSGNSDQVTSSLKVDVVREDGTTRLTLGYIGGYGETSSIETAKNHQGLLQIDLFLSKRVYLIPFYGKAYYDKYQNLDLRATASAGAGYYILREPDWEWTVELTGAYTYTEFREAVPGESRFDTEPQVRGATRMDWDITPKIEFIAKYEAFVGVEEVQNTFHHAEAYLYLDLFGDVIKLSVGLVLDRQENPQRLADGTKPEKNDLKYSVGLLVDF